MSQCARPRHAGDSNAGGPQSTPAETRVWVFVQAMTVVPKLACASELPGTLLNAQIPRTHIEFSQAWQSEI